MLALTQVLVQTYDVGLFAIKASYYLLCGIASMVDSHPVIRFDPNKMAQCQRLPDQSTQKQSVWNALQLLTLKNDFLSLSSHVRQVLAAYCIPVLVRYGYRSIS